MLRCLYNLHFNNTNFKDYTGQCYVIYLYFTLTLNCSIFKDDAIFENNCLFHITVCCSNSGIEIVDSNINHFF